MSRDVGVITAERSFSAWTSWHSRSIDEVLRHLSTSRDGSGRRRRSSACSSAWAQPARAAATDLGTSHLRRSVQERGRVPADCGRRHLVRARRSCRIDCDRRRPGHQHASSDSSRSSAPGARWRRCCSSTSQRQPSSARDSCARIDAATIVPGDIVQIDIGRRVPADARLIETTDFRTDEAALTGESLPGVEARRRGARRRDCRSPTARTWSTRARRSWPGTAIAVVTETGASTEIGRIGTLVGTIEEGRTPLERRLDELGRRLGVARAWRRRAGGGARRVQGAPLGLVVEMGIALAVAAVPEALPAVATIALAVGVHRMARRHALVRRLPAVEALGSATVVCTDKTRTLTSGRMTLVRLWTARARRRACATDAIDALDRRGPRARSGSDGEPAAAARTKGNRRRRAIRSTLRCLTAAEEAGIDRSALVAERPQEGIVPFSSDRKFMASFHRDRSGADGVREGCAAQDFSR